MMSNQRNVKNFCLPTQISCWESRNNVKPKKCGKLFLMEAAESSLEVSAHSGQLLESNNDVEPKNCGIILFM